MNPEKRKIVQQKLKAFLSMPPEKKCAIDENVMYDGLFTAIQEMSNIVESSENYKHFLEDHDNTLVAFESAGVEQQIKFNTLKCVESVSHTENIYLSYSQEIVVDSISEHYQPVNEDDEYSWAAA